ncbi:hypothetical protein D3C72_1967470 [compost metagenome]
MISALPADSDVTLFFTCVKLSDEFQVKSLFLTISPLIANSIPRLYMLPTFLRILLPGIPFDGDCGTSRISPFTLFLK